MKILLVEDSRTMQKHLLRCFETLGEHEILIARDGVDGLARAKEHPDLGLIVSDVNMPNLRGIEFVCAVREIHPETPVVMVTADVERQTVIDAIQAGANQYLRKPFDMKTFEQKIRPFVEAPRGA